MILLVGGVAIAVIERRMDGEMAVIFLLVAFMICASFLSFRHVKGRTHFKSEYDDDGGIDWHERGDGDSDPKIIDGWAVLIPDCAVFEAKETAARLESAGMRCRLECIHEDRDFHLWGNGGIGTRMCVLVPPSEYERAKALVA